MGKERFGQKGISFSPVTSTNVGVSPQNFVTFTFNPLAHWSKILRPYLEPIMELEPRVPRQKN